MALHSITPAESTVIEYMKDEFLLDINSAVQVVYDFRKLGLRIEEKHPDPKTAPDSEGWWLVLLKHAKAPVVVWCHHKVVETDDGAWPSRELVLDLVYSEFGDVDCQAWVDDFEWVCGPLNLPTPNLGEQ